MHGDASFGDKIQKLRVKTHFIKTVQLPRVGDGNVKTAFCVYKRYGVVLAFELSHGEDVSCVIFSHNLPFK